MLSVACATCNRRVPIYLLEKHHQDHMENREQEDEHELMVADMTVIRVKRRVPAEKEDKQVADIHGEGQPAEEMKGHMQKLSTIALYSSIL